MRYFHPDSDFKSPNWISFVEWNIDTILQNESIQMTKLLTKSFSFLPMINFSNNISDNNSHTLNNCNIGYYTNFHGYAEENNSFYFSERLETNKNNYLKFKKISNNISLTFPAFSCKKESVNAPSTKHHSGSKKNEYLTNLIMINAICNQFYPDKIKVEKINAQFESYIKKIIDSNDGDLLDILKSYTALLEDDHIVLKGTTKKKSSLFLLGVDWVLTSNNTLKILQTHPLFKELQNTEIVAINNVSIGDKINYYKQVVSSASPNSVVDKLIDNLRVVEDTNNFTLTFVNKDGNTKSLKITNHLTLVDYLSWENQYLPQNKQEIINDSIIYVDLTTNSFKNSIEFLSANTSKDVYLFLDMRGRPSGECYSFLSSLSTTEMVDSFMNIPVTNVDTTYFEKTFWKILPSHENKINYKKIFVLINHKTLSYGESIAYFLSKLPKSYLIGTRSSGCNGNVTTATLNGRTFSFTGMKVDYGSNIKPTALYPNFQYQFLNKKLTIEEFLTVIDNSL
ncbi:MAG: hypothetical protein IT232_11765 [Flavobacteriales bacterium]|nr:hypothetical protein [Flavobacteriales bacterium]